MPVQRTVVMFEHRAETVKGLEEVAETTRKTIGEGAFVTSEPVGDVKIAAGDRWFIQTWRYEIDRAQRSFRG